MSQSSLGKELQEELQAELLVLRNSEEVQQKKEQLEHTEMKPSLPGAPEFIPSSLPPLSTGTDSVVYIELALHSSLSQSSWDSV